jgi:hypothetical protein
VRTKTTTSTFTNCARPSQYTLLTRSVRHAETTSLSGCYKLLLDPNYCLLSSVTESVSNKLERSHLGGLLTRSGAG